MLTHTGTRRCAMALAPLALVALAGCGPAARPHQSNAADKTASSDKSAPDNGSASAKPGKKTGGTEKNGPEKKAGSTGASGECRSGDLSVTAGAGQSGGAGHVSTRLTFTNTSGHECWMRGYPGVSYVAGGNGAQVGASALRNGGEAPSAARITMLPNGHAYANFDQPQPRNFPKAQCDPTSVRGLRIYPPDETTALYAPDHALACGHGTAGRPSVGAVTKATE
ncbi:MAG TPA: DUF4232 domain-containing protein [Streptosporangiaceae bacterium]